MATNNVDYDDDSVNIEDESDFRSTIDDYKDLSLSSSDWTVETLYGQIKKGNINLSPEFQRRQVWDEKKQTAFIESLILGIPVPQIVIAQNGATRGKYLVLDGKQRLLSIMRFYDGALELRHPELLKELRGARYENMDSVYLDALDNATIRAVRLSGQKNEAVLFTIFHRLNSGSVSLNTQELRFALIPGPFARFASEFTEKDFELAQLFSATANGPDFRMRDIELLTRYCGIAHRPDLYGGSLKDFLDEATRWLNGLDDEHRYDSYATEATRSISVYRDVYREIETLKSEKIAAFSLLQEEKNARFNRAVFDALCFATQDVSVREAVSSKKKAVARQLMEVLSMPEFVIACSLSTKTKESLVKRVSLWSEALSACLGVSVKTLSFDDEKKIVAKRTV